MSPNRQASPKLSSSNLGVPVYHRRRRDWHDDEKLIVELSNLISKQPNLYNKSSKAVLNFEKKVNQITQLGFRENADAMLLATWIRECLVKLSNKFGNYDLRVHAIEIPEDIDELLNKKESLLTRSGFTRHNLSLSTLFPDPKVRGFALERIQVLHRGNIVEYLASLVSKEKDSLLGYSATIRDLIHICLHKLEARSTPAKCSFSTDECDIWVPSLKLGIEVRNSWDDQSMESLLNVLNNTNRRSGARFLSVVCPDDLSDLAFHSLRDVERKGTVQNLTIIRIGDFGKYLDRIIESKSPKLLD